MLIFFSLATDNFATPFSAVFIFQSVSITGILALGVTATLVVDGFDLSIGSTATSALMLSSYVMVVWEMSAMWAVVFCLLMGAMVGLVNGLLIVKMKVPDLLATLGMMFLLIGLQRIPTEGRSISTGMVMPDGRVTEGVFSPEFLYLGRHKFDFFIDNLIPVSVVVLLVLGFIVWAFMELTRHGRLMYAIGSNARAAELAGANVNRYKVLAYMISGVLDSVGGILLQGLTMMNAPYYTQDFVKGAVLVVALVFTFALSKRGGVH